MLRSIGMLVVCVSMCVYAYLDYSDDGRVLALDKNLYIYIGTCLRFIHM